MNGNHSMLRARASQMEDRLIEMAALRRMDAGAAAFYAKRYHDRVKSKVSERDYRETQNNYIDAQEAYEAICQEFGVDPYPRRWAGL